MLVPIHPSVATAVPQRWYLCTRRRLFRSVVVKRRLGTGSASCKDSGKLFCSVLAAVRSWVRLAQNGLTGRIVTISLGVIFSFSAGVKYLHRVNTLCIYPHRERGILYYKNSSRGWLWTENTLPRKSYDSSSAGVVPCHIQDLIDRYCFRAPTPSAEYINTSFEHFLIITKWQLLY